jgi:hypothetical protein
MSSIEWDDYFEYLNKIRTGIRARRVERPSYVEDKSRVGEIDMYLKAYGQPGLTSTEKKKKRPDWVDVAPISSMALSTYGSLSKPKLVSPQAGLREREQMFLQPVIDASKNLLESYGILAIEGIPTTSQKELLEQQLEAFKIYHSGDEELIKNVKKAFNYLYGHLKLKGSGRKTRCKLCGSLK